jgi:hypothetical protein
VSDEELSDDPDLSVAPPDDRPAETPFDNPFFLPVVLWGLAAWFGWDIVTNAQAYQDYPRFNQGGFAVLSVAAIYWTWGAFKERRAERGTDSANAE